MLNELGTKDVGILAAHYRDCPGELNIRRGHANDALYQQRIAAVRKMLTDAGVEVARISIADELVGGDGMESEHVLKILNVQNRPAASSPPRSPATPPGTSLRTQQ